MKISSIDYKEIINTTHDYPKLSKELSIKNDKEEEKASTNSSQPFKKCSPDEIYHSRQDSPMTPGWSGKIGINSESKFDTNFEKSQVFKVSLIQLCKMFPEMENEIIEDGKF